MAPLCSNSRRLGCEGASVGLCALGIGGSDRHACHAASRARVRRAEACTQCGTGMQPDVTLLAGWHSTYSAHGRVTGRAHTATCLGQCSITFQTGSPRCTGHSLISGATLKVVQEALCAASGATGPCPQQAAPGLDTLLRRAALPIGARCAVVLDVRASSAGAGDAHAALVDSARLARKDGDGAARQTGQGQAVRVLGALVRRQGSTAP